MFLAILVAVAIGDVCIAMAVAKPCCGKSAQPLAASRSPKGPSYVTPKNAALKTGDRGHLRTMYTDKYILRVNLNTSGGN